ncbi:hypothetical protein L3Q82_015238 [Scortum barcoo]|uniref:Uncharacterized protein n=1 Tax=Scortum barcoo TaxID=214431 RepID=A0ACB8VTB7_9TELE|nr:hypothetical protein L3Q82_015238 [Scortum barcoo]
MTNFSTIYKLSLVAVFCFIKACSSSCPVLECWFVQEKAGRGGGLTAATSQEKSLLRVRTDAHGHADESQKAPSDINPDRVYVVTDPAGTLCHRSLNPPRGSVKKPQCEINPFLPQPSSLKWVAPLTDSALSPIYLQADWFSTAIQGLDQQVAVANIMRAPTGTKEHNVILSVTSKTVSVQSRLGEPVLLDCGFWADPSSPLSGSGFAVEWRYQFRGDGRLVLAYDGKADRLADTQEEGATLDFEALHKNGNASLILQEAKVRHSGMYICTVYLPYLVAQVAVELEIVGRLLSLTFSYCLCSSLHLPRTSILSPSTPSPLPLAVPGQTLTIQCEASGFAPLSLDLTWEFKGARWEVQVSGIRQRNGPQAGLGWNLQPERPAGGFSAPSIEDSMAMVGVALVLYGLIKFVSWTFASSGSDEADKQDKVMLLFQTLIHKMKNS